MTSTSRSLLATALLATALHAAQDPVAFYVATNGNDGWSGQLPRPAENGKDGPKATLPAALEAARAFRRAKPGIVPEVLLRSGLYPLTAPLTLGAADSGIDAEHPFVLGAYKKETAVISGARRVTGWKPVKDSPGVWEVTLPEVKAGKAYYRSLFVNGERRQRARTPNLGYFRIQGDSPTDKPVRIRYREGDIRSDWAADGDVEVVALLAWAELRMQIRQVDAVAHVATLSGDPQPSNKENNAQYYVENAPDGVDMPGEWHLDRKSGLLRYFALPKEDPNRAQVLVPQLQELLTIQGDPAAAARHITLRGLTFAYTDWTLPTTGYADTQAAFSIPGDVRLEFATDCSIERCTLTGLSGYGIALGRGAQRIQITRNELLNLGAGGIRVGEPEIRSEPREANHSHVITDNHLAHLGRVYPAGIGVIIFQSGTNLVAHNHIHDLFYSAVSVGWNWGYQETPCRENRIEFNHLHDLGQSLLSDMGAVYTLGIQPGTRVANNLIHDVNAFTYGGWGLYTDEGSTGIVLESNVVYRCKSAGFHQHYGRDNLVRNNVFAFNREHQLMRSRDEAHNSFTFENNIVYFDSGDLLGSTWANNNFRLNRNLYFDTRLSQTPAALKFKDDSFAQWQQRGHDPESLLVDPLFVAPDKFNFDLKKNSPALKLGFQRIDLSTVGIRKP